MCPAAEIPEPSAGGRSRQEFGEDIKARYLGLLSEAGSPLLGSESVVQQVVAQLFSVLDALAPTLRWSPATAPDVTTGPDASIAAAESPADDLDLSAQIGKARAATGANPAQSLRAAALMFQAALPAVSDRLAVLGHERADRDAALLLNRTIMDRMSMAALSYIDVVLTKAQAANQDERRRVSRDLHDVAAPAVAVALQGLELYEVYAVTDPEQADRKLAATQKSMREVLRLVRGLSAELREGAGAIGLTAALQRYLDTIPPVPAAELRVEGPVDTLSAAYSEEVFLLLREAFRNAISHARAERVLIEVKVSASELTASVRDDGCGFDLERTLARHRHVGLDSMRERAELLGGTLTMQSAPGEGSLVAVRVQIPPTGTGPR
ncbi:MAG: two-component system histidine kinase [Frankiales bacterium]|jgi:signal transduction histidine kinase|nr:two-component system histidine kinase [Frankiales bacterium]